MKWRYFSQQLNYNVYVDDDTDSEDSEDRGRDPGVISLVTNAIRR